MTNNNDDKKSIMDRYAEASHDVEMLTMFLQGLANDKNAQLLGMQKVLERAITRAEAEVMRLKIAYEGS